MDLALAFGVPVPRLERSLTGLELHDWMRYARQRGGLPLTRIETLLARLCVGIDRGLLGISESRLSDYLPDLEQQEREALAERVETTVLGDGKSAKGTVVRGIVSPIDRNGRRRNKPKQRKVTHG